MKKPLNLGKKVGVLLCGGNIDLNLVARIIDRGQIKRGRVAKISVVVSDLPGNLNLLTQALAQERANVLEVHHDRVRSSLYLRETQIDFVIECTGKDHIEKVKTALCAVGAKLIDEEKKAAARKW
jgi:threonine dehydratase